MHAEFTKLVAKYLTQRLGAPTSEGEALVWSEPASEGETTTFEVHPGKVVFLMSTLETTPVGCVATTVDELELMRLVCATLSTSNFGDNCLWRSRPYNASFAFSDAISMWDDGDYLV